MEVGVNICEGLCDAVPLTLPDSLAVGEALGVPAALAEPEGLCVRRWLKLRVPVCEGVRVWLPLPLGVRVDVGLGVRLGVWLRVRVWLPLRVCEAVPDPVCEGVAVPAQLSLVPCSSWARKGSCGAHVAPSSRLSRLAYAVARPAAGTLLLEPLSTP